MGIEPQRKSQLVEAAIAVIGETGSLDVTVGKIARRAGVSAALAFHYFGDKESLFLAAMRHVMQAYAAAVLDALSRATDPRSRLEAIVTASLGPENFQPGVAGAWLNFYVLAHKSGEAKRLLGVYRRRLQSNLVHDLRPLAGDRAGRIAERIGALIDGLYLRSAQGAGEDAGPEAIAHVLSVLDLELKACS